MLTLNDCLSLCDLTEEEIEAIVQHEHIPEIVAIELGQYLVTRPNGERYLKRIILDGIAEAERRGDEARTAELRKLLHHFIRTHPGLAAAKAGRTTNRTTKRTP